ncbi:MAG TPA: DUF3168 domain-containing protein [Alphaproteobacteria bacterium]|nr:DUF3168 domain-containing protein [Alphaproteobacteria bacterium]
MTDALFSVQEAVLSALTASSEVQSVLGSPARVYDHVPVGAVFPYAVFGPLHIAPYDTKTEIGFEQIVTLNIWSRYRGAKEVKDIFQAIYDTLHRATLSVAGEVFLSCEFHSADIMPDSDGLTYQGEVRYAIITQTT